MATKDGKLRACKACKRKIKTGERYVYTYVKGKDGMSNQPFHFPSCPE